MYICRSIQHLILFNTCHGHVRMDEKLPSALLLWQTMPDHAAILGMVTTTLVLTLVTVLAFFLHRSNIVLRQRLVHLTRDIRCGHADVVLH